MATFLYNPDRKSKAELIAEFVVRTEIYDDIMYDLETSKMDRPEQHYLLVGQRGAGKTTLLNRIKYGIEDSRVLKDKVIPVIFSEEQYNISELVNLWESVAQHLEDYYGFEGLYEAVEAHQVKEDFEEVSYDILEKHLKKNKKKLVLLIDNIGDILKKLEKTEIHRLREVLQTKSEIRLIAGSPFYLESVLDYQQPLFEFFKVLRLDGLNEKETQDLLLKLGEVNGGKEQIEKIIRDTPERIETLRTLTGGVPRTIALMFNIFIEYNNEDTVKDLEKILDAVTPLYKHRMDDLPTQQQKIVDAVAKNWDGISVKELKERVRIESKTVSAQLRQLEKNQIIEKVETSTKNNIYFLKERFFNIWYLMRYGRKYDKQRVIWLVKFLESWCTINEIEQRILDYVRKIRDGKLENQLIDFYGEVYTAMEHLRDEIKFFLKGVTPSYLSKRIIIDETELVKLAETIYNDGDIIKAFQLVTQFKEPEERKSYLVLKVMLALLRIDRKQFHDWFSEVEKDIKVNNSEKVGYVHYLWMVVFYSVSCLDNLADNQVERAHKSLKMLVTLSNLSNSATDKGVNALVHSPIVEFLAFGQVNIVRSVFDENPVLKDKIKPVYYAFLKLMGDQNESLKMGAELSESVNTILQEVKKVQEDLILTMQNQTDSPGGNK